MSRQSNYEEMNLRQAISERDEFTEGRYQQFYRFMHKSASQILDIGCNTGKGGQVLKRIERALVISGLDIVKDRLDRLPAGVYVNNVHGSCTDIPCGEGTFDVVLAGEFIEHLYPLDVDKALAEMFRVLKIGGQVLLTTPNPGDVKRILRKESILGGPHVSQHHHDALRMKLRMIGFSKVRVYGSGKVSRYLGSRFPLLCVYGSYLICGSKY